MGDCDPWSEPETEWHLNWKSKFSESDREVTLKDNVTGEFHRADVMSETAKGPIVVEFQHSSISAEEQSAREEFYGRYGRLFWVLDLQPRAWNFAVSLNFGKPTHFRDKTFYKQNWGGRSQFIDRWKKSDTHVFLNLGDEVFYLATPKACRELVANLTKGEYYITPINLETFVCAVQDYF
jgi:hypothetical protein